MNRTQLPILKPRRDLDSKQRADAKHQVAHARTNPDNQTNGLCRGLGWIIPQINDHHPEESREVLS